jgi:lipoprotein-anchoring transpeptidase ErfK/SrfK
MIRRNVIFGMTSCLLMLPQVALARQDGAGNVGAREFSDEPFRVSHRDLTRVPRRFRRQQVSFKTEQEPGTIIVDVTRHYLYLVLEKNRALRYGIGVGREGFAWAGIATVERKAMWPKWIPPKEMVERDPFAARWADGMPGGLENPLGARALYLYADGRDTLYRIHGTSEPDTIGKAVSSGCVRLLNADIIDLYERVEIGSTVVVKGASDLMLSESHAHHVEVSQPADRDTVHSRRRNKKKTLFDLWGESFTE